MNKVDFGFVNNNGCTIFRICFEKYIQIRKQLFAPIIPIDPAIVRRRIANGELKNVVERTEKVFFFLVEEAKKYQFDVDSILEIPDSTGQTCFGLASLASEKMTNYIITRKIPVNSLTTSMITPQFKYPMFAIEMMKKGINPHIISCDGIKQTDLFPKTNLCFENLEAKRLLSQFPRSIHFSTEDIQCDESCQPNCTSTYKRFYYKNGPLVEMTDHNRIGQGGFGMIFRELFHGVPMAMKCVLLTKLEDRYELNQAISDLEKNISELRIQIASKGSGVIVPVAFIRQQNQEKNSNGQWIAKNYNIYIYPLYDCNLYELHGNHYDRFTETILGDIIDQCIIRKGSC